MAKADKTWILDTAKKEVENLSPLNLDTLSLRNSDTATINHKKFVLSVYRNDTICFFEVKKGSGNKFTTILVDSDYITNNSDLFFQDENKDGYLDIVWTKKWQDHSYLYNPEKDNFIEVGEFHDIDTLKIAGHPALFNNKYPILYLMNSEKSFERMTELHSELFIINNNYQKISFATIDNFASLDDWNAEKCTSANSVVVNCYVPPYFGKYGEYSIWNSGKSVDSVFMKSNKFDSLYITKYWATNYQKLLQYGQVFKVRREAGLKYF